MKCYLDNFQTPEEWRTVFLITAGVYAMGALLYGLLASGEKQDWADGDMTGLLDVEKEKSEFYYSEKDYSYGATDTNGQVIQVLLALCINL